MTLEFDLATYNTADIQPITTIEPPYILFIPDLIENKVISV